MIYKDTKDKTKSIHKNENITKFTYVADVYVYGIFLYYDYIIITVSKALYQKHPAYSVDLIF